MNIYILFFPAECDAKDSYVVCARCTESVHKQLYEFHQMEDYCRGNFFLKYILIIIISICKIL